MTDISTLAIVCVAAQLPTSPGKRYHYLVPAGDMPKVGDLLVTSVSWDDYSEDEARGEKLLSGAGLATVAEVLYEVAPAATKQYLFLISREALEARRQENRARQELDKQKKAAKLRLDAMLKQMDQTAMYERLATTSPEAAALLSILRS